jgi:hypothetical protein
MFGKTGKGLRFVVLTATSMKMPIYWVVVPCNLVEVYRPEGVGSKHL